MVPWPARDADIGGRVATANCWARFRDHGKWMLGWLGVNLGLGVDGACVIWKRVCGANRSVAALRHGHVVRDRRSLRPEDVWTRREGVQGWTAFLYWSLAGRERFVVYSHVREVRLSSGEERFMWVFVAANHVKLPHDVSFHILCLSRSVPKAGRRINREHTILPYGIKGIWY